jgi:NAD(P)-dependent dehydrogenase (short-subunit alcohol dehydrogenase family)
VHVFWSCQIRLAQRKVADLPVDNSTGGNICYRLSKTAVNQLTKTVAVDLAKMGSKVITLAIHPGYLPTKMNDYYGENDMAECINGMTKTIEAFGTAETMNIPNGGYVDWNGKVLAF